MGTAGYSLNTQSPRESCRLSQRRTSIINMTSLAIFISLRAALTTQWRHSHVFVLRQCVCLCAVVLSWRFVDSEHNLFFFFHPRVFTSPSFHSFSADTCTNTGTREPAAPIPGEAPRLPLMMHSGTVCRTQSRYAYNRLWQGSQTLLKVYRNCFKKTHNRQNSSKSWIIQWIIFKIKRHIEGDSLVK